MQLSLRQVTISKYLVRNLKLLLFVAYIKSVIELTEDECELIEKDIEVKYKYKFFYHIEKIALYLVEVSFKNISKDDNDIYYNFSLWYKSIIRLIKYSKMQFYFNHHTYRSEKAYVINLHNLFDRIDLILVKNLNKLKCKKAFLNEEKIELILFDTIYSFFTVRNIRRINFLEFLRYNDITSSTDFVYGSKNIILLFKKFIRKIVISEISIEKKIITFESLILFSKTFYNINTNPCKFLIHNKNIMPNETNLSNLEKNEFYKLCLYVYNIKEVYLNPARFKFTSDFYIFAELYILCLNICEFFIVCKNDYIYTQNFENRKEKNIVLSLIKSEINATNRSNAYRIYPLFIISQDLSTYKSQFLNKKKEIYLRKIIFFNIKKELKLNENIHFNDFEAKYWEMEREYSQKKLNLIENKKAFLKETRCIRNNWCYTILNKTLLMKDIEFYKELIQNIFISIIKNKRFLDKIIIPNMSKNPLFMKYCDSYEKYSNNLVENCQKAANKIQIILKDELIMTESFEWEDFAAVNFESMLNILLYCCYPRENQVFNIN